MGYSINLTHVAISNSTSNTAMPIPTPAQWVNNYFLHANGSWQIPVTPNTVPGGPNTSVQFNDSSAFGGNAAFTFNKTTGLLHLGNSTVNVIANSTVLKISDTVTNTTINSSFGAAQSSISYGNTTVNVSINSTAVGVSNSTVTGRLTSNVLTNIPVVGSINGTLFYLTFPGGATQTATLLYYAPFDCTFTMLRHQMTAGAVTMSVLKNGAGIGGLSSLATNTTVQNSTPTSNNTLTTGDRITVTFTSVANTDDDFHYVMFLTRTGF